MFPVLIANRLIGLNHVVRVVGFTHYLHLGDEVWHFLVSGQETQVGVVLGILVLLGLGEQRDIYESNSANSRSVEGCNVFSQGNNMLEIVWQD